MNHHTRAREEVAAIVNRMNWDSGATAIIAAPPMPILGFVLFSGWAIWVTEGGVRIACLRLARFFILLYHETSRYFMMVTMMTTATREKFSSQAAPEVLLALRNIAENQGRQFQAVLDDALRDYIDRQQKESPRRHVMAAFASSMDEFDHLYRELAK